MEISWIKFVNSWSLGDGHEEICCNDTLAHHMIERGFENVKVAIGDEMERYDEYYIEEGRL